MARGMNWLISILRVLPLCIFSHVLATAGVTPYTFTEAAVQSETTDGTEFAEPLNITHAPPHLYKNNSTDIPEPICPSNVECYKLGGDCIDCDFDYTKCIYGKQISTSCHPKAQVNCTGPQNFTRSLACLFCYQTPHWEQKCTPSTSCRSVSSPRQRYQANCTVKDDVLCMGKRRFYKMLKCNWTSGYRWSTALVLSITLGGFGVDRFYLGLWREGIGKLFSFGGLGVWTIVDVILIATGYVGPADGSLYIY